MNRTFSLYLDLLRFCAAFTVFMGHAGSQRLSGGLLWQFQRYGPEAVMIFFVMSGLVIAFTAETKDVNWRDYAVSRLSRLYSVVIPAVLLTVVLDFLGQQINPGAYNISWGFDHNDQASHYLLALLNLGYIWNFQFVPGSNAPFWSLCYEFWYYVIFAAFFYVRGPLRWAAFFVACAVAGPNIILLLPVWLMGVVCYWIIRRGGVTPALGWIFFVGTAVVITGYFFYTGGGSETRTVFPALTFTAHREFLDQNYIERYFLGLLVSLHFIGFHAVSTNFAVVLNRFSRAIRWLTGYTFSLYLFHFPIMQFIFSITSENRGSWANRILLYGGSLALVVVLGAVSEKKKGLLRDVLRRWFGLPPSGVKSVAAT